MSTIVTVSPTKSSKRIVHNPYEFGLELKKKQQQQQQQQTQEKVTYSTCTPPENNSGTDSGCLTPSHHHLQGSPFDTSSHEGSAAVSQVLPDTLPHQHQGNNNNNDQGSFSAPPPQNRQHVKHLASANGSIDHFPEFDETLSTHSQQEDDYYYYDNNNNMYSNNNNNNNNNNMNRSNSQYSNFSPNTNGAQRSFNNSSTNLPSPIKAAFSSPNQNNNCYNNNNNNFQQQCHAHSPVARLGGPLPAPTVGNPCFPTPQRHQQQQQQQGNNNNFANVLPAPFPGNTAGMPPPPAEAILGANMPSIPVRNKSFICKRHLDCQRRLLDGGKQASYKKTASCDCSLGGMCPYRHIHPFHEEAIPKSVCKFHLNGACLRDVCPFFHGSKEALQKLHESGAPTYRLADYCCAVDAEDHFDRCDCINRHL